MDLDLQQFSDLAAAGKWLPLSALLVFSIVRLLKSDVALPSWLPPVPPRYRLLLAILLSSLAAFLAKLGAGLGWRAALGLAAATFLTSLVAHHGIVENIRGGEDVPIPPKLRKTVDDVIGAKSESAAAGDAFRRMAEKEKK